MPLNDKIYVGDINTIIALDSQGVVLTGAGVLKIKYIKPSGSTGEWVATVDPGDTNVAIYTTALNDLDVAGIWAFQTYAELPSGWKGHGEIAKQRVYEPIEVTP